MESFLTKHQNKSYNKLIQAYDKSTNPDEKKAIHKLVDDLEDIDDCDLEVGPLQKLTKEKDLMVYKHTGQWECMDHERDVSHLNKLWKAGEAFWKKW